MSANERAELAAMHAHERQLCDQLDKLDEELQASQQQTAEVEAERQLLLDEFQQLQVQVRLTMVLLNGLQCLQTRVYRSPMLDTTGEATYTGWLQ